MTLQQYQNQQEARLSQHYSVILSPSEYTVYYIDRSIAGIHIHKYPEHSYVVTEKSGYVSAIKEQPHRTVYKPTVFRVNTEHITSFNFNFL